MSLHSTIDPVARSLEHVTAALEATNTEDYNFHLAASVTWASIAHSATDGRRHLRDFGHPLYRKGDSCGTCGRNVSDCG